MDIGAYGNTPQVSKSGWNIECDVNDGCKVDILHMILVRNKLNADTATEDNWKAEVTRDGSMNILDMILVRNNLNTTCE